MPVAAAAPYIASAIGTIAAGQFAKSGAKGDVAQMQPGIAGAYGNANNLQQTGRTALGVGLPLFQQGAGYFSSLMRSRQGAQAATAPAAANITDAYGGAQRGLERSFVRGGERDMALADLNRDKTNQISRLYAGVQPAAAQAVTGAGSQMFGQGIGATQAATQAFGTGGQLAYGAGTYVGDQTQKSGAAFGNLLFNIMKNIKFGRGFGGGGGPSPGAGDSTFPGYGWNA